ncbi:arrestin domain-containing protein 17 [Condylostylus longicornis]|uniref:arrestin domain-containing protein 17 n=1 Tax=Condylostylus longicornis TaxID=2530218 RepID=UPI00244DBE75|nr:arrestin domain-containing protein 17 [Condylostylus longicornis]
MGIKGCQIQLDNPWNTYYAGQTVNGQVLLTFDKPKKVRGITARFLGEANTSWQEVRKTTNTQTGKEEDETENLTGHEEYFQIQYYILGGKNAAETELPAGTHTYPFSCALPPTLPSSFEGAHGHVRYTIKITLDRPWKFDQDMKMAFTVISPVDLNLNPRIKEPAKLELEKSFCCFCCKSGPLAVIVHVPVSGYVSGQIIPITAECDNASNVDINIIKFILRKVVTFTVTQPRADKKVEKVTIAELNVGPIAGNESKNFNQQLEIPPLPPSNLQNCGLIDLDYQLYIEVDVSGPHTNLTGHIPITLGTIPLVSFQPPAPMTDVPIQDPSMAPTQPVSPASPPNGSGGALGWNMGDSGQLYPNMPPPTFSEGDFKPESIVDRQDSEHTALIGNFAPRYPTYQFNKPSAPSY